MQPSPSPDACAESSLTSSFNMAARLGGFFFSSSKKLLHSASEPCAIISTYGPLLQTVPRMPAAAACLLTVGLKPTPWTMP